MSLSVQKDTKFTYADYLNWPEEESWEIIDGVPYNMSPAPKVRHQAVSRNIEVILVSELRGIGSRCEVFDAPTDVVLDEYNVVRPDLFVICDKTKITENNIQGVPDLVFEVASPATEIKDKREKKNLYERFGVKEYVIVYPDREYVERFLLTNGKYGASEILNYNEILKLRTFEIGINLWEVFDKELPVI